MFTKDFYHYLIAIVAIVFFMTSCVSTKEGADLKTHDGASRERLEVVQSRGLEQKFILTSPKKTPVANVILIAGGHGKINFRSSSGSVRWEWGKYTFALRTRWMFVDSGFLVATIDAPSDRKKMDPIWRMSEAHSEDIDAVVKFLKKQANVPIWIIGSSRGSFSTANAGIRLNQSINGIVLTSPVTKSVKMYEGYKEFPDGIINMNLAQVKVPVLVISHKNDKCEPTPAKNIDLLANQFTASPKVDKIVFSGGDGADSDKRCGKGSAHGFAGIEKDVVDRIASFIKSN